MIRFPLLFAVSAGLFLALGARPTPAVAADGDKAGWQLRIEGEGEAERQFLTYVQRDNGPRILTFACEPDIDTFGFYADDLGDLSGPISRTTMTLSSGQAKFNIPGSIQPSPDTQVVGFVSEIPLSGPDQQQQLASTLAAFLLSDQPIHMAFGAKSRDLPPISGVLAPAKRFLRSCFSR